jgi:hypothetical protein
MQVQLNALGWSVPSAGSACSAGRGIGGNAGAAALLRQRTLDDLLMISSRCNAMARSSRLDGEPG